jgi:hypothetical protein
MLLPGGDGSASSSNILSLSSAMLGCCGPFPTLLQIFEDAGCTELDCCSQAAQTQATIFVHRHHSTRR